MEKLDDVVKQINYLRKQMHSVIDQNDELIDPQVISISQKLDDVLNQYNLLKYRF